MNARNFYVTLPGSNALRILLDESGKKVRDLATAYRIIRKRYRDRVTTIVTRPA